MAQTIYNYNPITGDFISMSEADDSPLEPGIFLMPANATTLSPPIIEAGQVTRYIDGSWVIDTLPDPAQNVEGLKTLKKIEIESSANTAMFPITVYSQSERDTWPTQESEADSWTANHAAATPMLSAIAAQRGMAIDDLVSAVLIKASEFKVLAGSILGNRKAKIDLIAAATTAEELRAIVW